MAEPHLPPYGLLQTFILFGDRAQSAKVGIDISSSAPLQATGDVPFTNFIVEGDFSFGGSAQLFKLNIAFKHDTTVIDQYNSVTDFIGAATTGERIGELIVQGASYWLAKYIGSSHHTIGDVMVSANMLGESTDKDSGAHYYHYDEAALEQISTDPLEATENILFALLGALADNDKPILPLQGGGIWVAYEPTANGSTPTNKGNYGLRLMIPDIPIKLGKGPTSPTLHLRLGSWFSGEGSDKDGWVNKIVGGSDPMKPGVSILCPWRFNDCGNQSRYCRLSDSKARRRSLDHRRK